MGTVLVRGTRHARDSYACYTVHDNFGDYSPSIPKVLSNCIINIYLDRAGHWSEEQSRQEHPGTIRMNVGFSGFLRLD